MKCHSDRSYGPALHASFPCTYAGSFPTEENDLKEELLGDLDYDENCMSVSLAVVRA
jgi:hypothetical protein